MAPRGAGAVAAAAASAGGRISGKFKPSNQDAFLLKSLDLTTLPGDTDEEQDYGAACWPAPMPAVPSGRAAVVAIFDGHGKHGKQAAEVCRMSINGALRRFVAGAAALRAGGGSAWGEEEEEEALRMEAEHWLRVGFNMARDRLAAATRNGTMDFHMSGTTALVCMVLQDRWAKGKCECVVSADNNRCGCGWLDVKYRGVACRAGSRTPLSRPMPSPVSPSSDVPCPRPPPLQADCCLGGRLSRGAGVEHGCIRGPPHRSADAGPQA
jgi:hypothetical protein